MWTNLLGEFQAHQDTCQWPHPDGKGGGVLEEGQRLPLLIPFHSSLFLSPSARTSLASNFLSFDVSKLYFQDIGTWWPLSTCTMVLDQQIWSSILPSCHDLPHISLSSLFAVLKKRFLEFANGVINHATRASEADWAGTSVWVFLLSCLVQFLRCTCCLGRHKQQWCSLVRFHLPYKFHTWYNGRSKITTVSFLICLRKNGGASLLLLVKSRRLKGVNI